jgi:penicillin-binding protein 2
MNGHGGIPDFRRRYRYLMVAVGITFAVLVGRLWQMQLIQGESYTKKSANNFVQEIRIPTVRGLILDRKGRPLVTNRPSFDVCVTPRFATPAGLDRLTEELSLTPDAAKDLRQRVLAVSGRKRFDPLIVVRDISRDQMARLEVNKEELPGASIMARAYRSYAHGNLAAHVLGYLNEVTPDELAHDVARYYQPGDFLGRFGVERMYETFLRGVPGRERIVVDARGRRKTGEDVADLLKGETRREPEPGDNLVLTIDVEVQRLAERALRSYPSGAAVVLEVNTGRVLASASKPAFDPNILTGRLSPEEAARLVNDPYRPLLDKVFRENYYPGSTYKVVAAITALEEHRVNPEDKITCTGAHSFGRRTFRCSHAHGKVNLIRAIVESCNVYFYTLAEQVGMDAMARYAELLGLGSPTGLGLNGEVGGFIPTREWYVRRKQPFRIGFTLNSAIGQGNVKVTPIQIANLYATIANGGTVYLPQIIERVETAKGIRVQTFAPRVRRRVPLRPATVALLQEALFGVVNDEKGTASASRMEDIAVSGKTGTAQVSRRIKKGKTIWLEDHSWFAAYAPSERPTIAVAVLVEHGGRAAKVAAPVAMEIIRSYFRYVAPHTASTAPESGEAPGAAGRAGP